MTPKKLRLQGAGGLFGDPPSESKTETKPAAYFANIDGGSRGNPGPAAYGVVIRNPSGETTARLKKYIGKTTNNVAEYYALIAALDYAQSQNIRALRILSDSELLVNQMRGRYKVKSADLKPLFERARKMSGAFELFSITHVYREKNAEADQLANDALDEVSGPSARPANSTQKAGSESRPLEGRIVSGALVLTEKLDLPDGAEVEILIRPKKK